jgi:hypothetical protein
MQQEQAGQSKVTHIVQYIAARLSRFHQQATGQIN